MCVDVCIVHTCFICIFVGSCLATKDFIGNLPAIWKGLGQHKDEQR